MTQSTCTIDECEREVLVVRRGLCKLHYSRWQRTGNANHKPKTPAERFWSKVEKTDDCWAWCGGKMPNGYGNIHIGNKFEMAHRFSYELNVGKIPARMFIDHVCHNRMCVNPDHLRLATVKQNGEHRKGPASNNNGSGVRGVYRNGSKWSARVGHNGKTLNFGTYATIEEAEAAVIEARRRLFTHSQD